ncbi:MAG: hypothetical protein LQ349_007333 [Xanthoria aureola]|nr:MAG: hypothetical protein LQ349_007333 [Xanthoria aureola]
MSKSFLYWLCLLSSFISKRYLVIASGCFYAYNSTILPSPEFVEPCGTNMSPAGRSFVNCCATGFQNLCLAESICYDPYTDDGKYYLSPCTDPSYNSSVCPQYCIHRSHQNQLDIIYDHTARIWRCCGVTKGKSDCGNPTNETFSAPAPANLSTVYASSTSSLPTSASSAFSPTTLVTLAENTSLSPPRVTPADPSKSHAEEGNQTGTKEARGGLSTSDKVAIAVSIPGTLATMVGAYFTYVAYRAREKRKKKQIIFAGNNRQARPRRP